MTSKTFNDVWFLPSENTWAELNILAYRDKGTLTVSDNALHFRSSKGQFLIRGIRGISFGKQGRDFVNNWVKVEYGEESVPTTAFFADGSMLGWGGILGGTKKILTAVRQCQSA